MPSTLRANLVGSLELALAAAGLLLLWRFVLSPEARRNRLAPRLPEWPVPAAEFLLFLVLVLLGSFAFAATASFVGKKLHLRGDAVTVFNGAAAQLGLFLGAVVFRLRIDRWSPRVAMPERRILLAGAATFLISLPIVMLAAKSSEYLLEWCGLPADRQDLVGMFAHADSAGLLSIMITLAVVIAPLTEELVFRAGLFRYARTRLPRALALLLPALFFAALHVNWSTLQGLASLAPLVALAIIFSLAYERTGHIATSMVAHALFNLNTVLLILSGAIE